MCGISSGAAAWAALQIASGRPTPGNWLSRSCRTLASAISRRSCSPIEFGGQHTAGSSTLGFASK